MNKIGAMTQATEGGRQTGPTSLFSNRNEGILLGVVLLLLGLHLSTALQRAINWDEYFHYSQIQNFVRGDHVQPLQTLYVRAFAWVTDLPGSEIDHIIVVRLFMLGCLAITAVSIFGTVSNLSSRAIGLLCAACYLSAGLVLHHGTAFRTDVMAAALLSLALWSLASSSLSWRSVALIGTLVGIAGMVTIKAVLWLPAFMGIGLVRWQARRWEPFLLLRFLTTGLVAAITFALVYFFHSRGLAPDPDASAGKLIGNASSRMFVFPYFEKWPVILTAGLTALPFAALVVATPLLLARSKIKPAMKGGVLSVWIVALIPLVYVNSYPYFYTFILPPVAVSIYLAVEAASARYGALALTLVLAFTGTVNWVVDERGVLKNQRQVLEVIKQSIPGPVTYFDCCSSIGAWPSGNGFRTVWGIEQYLASEQAEFRSRMLLEPVPLLVAGGWSRQLFQGSGPIDQFLPEDADALQATYVHFWGPLYLAGTELNPFQDKTWRVFVPGTYTVEGAVAISGTEYANGEAIEIQRGTLNLRETDGAPARLVWGDRILKPNQKAPEKLWTGWVE